MKKIYPKTAAVILAAGLGSRMLTNRTKQTINILGKSILRRSLESFDSAETVSEIVVVAREEEFGFVNKECQSLSKPFTIVNGGSCRAESASLGFFAVSEECEFVLIHDAARCLVTPMEINCVAEAVYKYGAATASLPMIDTVKKCTDEHIIMGTLDRRNLRTVQTPQGFSKAIYKKALDAHSILSPEITDDNMLLEKIGVSSFCVDTLSTNIKITAPSDIELAEFIITKRNKVG